MSELSFPSTSSMTWPVVDSGVTDGGAGMRAPPCLAKLKNGPHQRFRELQNMKVLQFLEIRWS